MCCPGCQAVASAIVVGGLDRFYDYRSKMSENPQTDRRESLEHYDLVEVQEEFTHRQEDGTFAIELLVKGMTCSACAWLIEHHVSKVPGVCTVAVNVSSHRCRLVWEPETVLLSEILHAFEAIGYQARPASDSDAEHQRSRENKTFLLRLGLAGLGMMQAGHAAIGLYAGDFSGIEAHWELLLRWVSLVIVTPVVLYSAWPFYSAALRSLRVGHLVMDVPVSLAIVLAYFASLWATVTGTGEVYYDSVAMFVFLLLLARYLELRARLRNERQTASLSRLVPAVAQLLRQGVETPTPVKSLMVGDCVRVGDGEILPCDGEIIRGASELVEAVLSGEQAPVAKGPGDIVYAGSCNGQNPLEVRVLARGDKTRLAAILDLVGAAKAMKPQGIAQADRLASGFVAAVLSVAVLVAIIWAFIDPAKAFWVSLSVLVVTCPCALSLATPAAATMAMEELRKIGFLIRKPHVLERLGELDYCLFDKTGTLTLGDLEIVEILPTAGQRSDRLWAIAATLEQGLSHPIARAFKSTGQALSAVEEQQVTVGRGVSGIVDGRRYVLGKGGFAAEVLGVAVAPPPGESGLWLCLADTDEVIGWFHLEDELRPGALEVADELRQLGLGVEILSGDRSMAVASLAKTLAVDGYRGDASPEDKLAYGKELQSQGKILMMVGDGINDAPLLGGADVSVALGDAVDLTKLHADALLVAQDLRALPAALKLGRRTARIVRQNIAWALLYNLVALPLAALGQVPPWAAAIGMSASSLLVVANALRLATKAQPLPTPASA